MVAISTGYLVHLIGLMQPQCQVYLLWAMHLHGALHIADAQTGARVHYIYLVHPQGVRVCLMWPVYPLGVMILFIWLIH